MSTRGTTKPARPAAKGTVKTPGKDQIKGEKPSTNILEIVPGKFNETDWLSLIENDETEDFIADIYDDIWKETSKQIQEIYLRRQLLPYTLMTIEDALTSVIQWAFLKRDEPKPVNGDFWMNDDEPIPCSMDNWGEGVVPACREIHRQNIEESPVSVTERSPSPLINIQTPENLDEIQRSLSKSSNHSQISPTGQFPEEQSIKNDYDDHTSSTKKTLRRSSFEQKPYNHDILVIETEPPKLEPLSDLFYASQTQTSSSTPHPTKIRRRHTMAPKASSQLGSDALASTTNITETTKSTKKVESKLFDDQHIEDIISKAPVAAQSMLKSILSRPPGYRELELDDYGNVIAIAKLDPDRLAPRSVRVKCDIIKPRKSMIEPRSLPKHSQSMKLTRSDPKFAPVKLKHSTNVGDLIQPMPGVLYEDSKIKKGDPRRYKNGMSKYANFYDESRPLKPIARRSDFALLQTANDLLRISKDYNNDNDNEQDSQIPKLHRLARIPPIMSPSNASSV